MAAQVKLFPGDAQEGNNQVNNNPVFIGAVSGSENSGSHVAANDDREAQTALDELRVQFEDLRSEFAAIAASRAKQAAQLADQGADEVRTQIRKAPGTSLAVAALAGGLLAVLMTSQRRHEPTWRDSARETAARYQAALRDLDVNDLALRVRRSADGAIASTREQTAGIMPGIERLAQSLSTMDSSAFGPALEKGSNLVKSIWASVAPSR